MPQFTIHGHAYSTCSRRILAVVAHIGAWDQVELITHDFHETKTPEWFENQPFGQMPYMIDNETGFVLYESRAICRYIARKVGSESIPSETDVEATALFDRAASVEQSDFDESASKLVSEIVFKPQFGGKTDEAAVEALTATLAKKLEGYDRMLAKSTYVAGDKLTLVDLFHLPYGNLTYKTGKIPQLTDGSLPNLARWWKEVGSLPCWEKANEPLRNLHKA